MLMKKIFTFLAVAIMALCANAQSKTATFGASSISGLDKDTDVPCEGFTLAGTYFAAGTSKVTVFGDDKGMKVRANKGADANQFALTVNEGCIITKLEMGMVVNDASSTFILSGISVDGTPVADFTAVALPNTADADGSAVVNLDNIKATQDITFTFNFDEYTGKNRQVFIAGEVTYEEGVIAPVEGETDFTPSGVNPMHNTKFDVMKGSAKLNGKVLEVTNFPFAGANFSVEISVREGQEGSATPLCDLIPMSGFTKTGELDNWGVIEPLYSIDNQPEELIVSLDGVNSLKFTDYSFMFGYYTSAQYEKVSATEAQYDTVLLYLCGKYQEFTDGAWGAVKNNGYIQFNVIVPVDVTTAIETVAADFDENAPVEYYNLQGVRVANPANGIFIKRQGNKVEKVLVK